MSDIKWGNCEANGCPLPATISSGKQTCTYHYQVWGGEAQQITNQINRFIGYKEKYWEMIKWSAYEWANKELSLRGWDVLPKGQSEPPTVYLARFDKWIDEKIKGL